jgi:hypothetical protein
MNAVGVTGNTWNQGKVHPMRRGKKNILFSALALVAVIGAVAVVWSINGPAVPDPEYQGKKLSAWLKETIKTQIALPIGGGAPASFVRENLTPQAQLAIVAMGTNAAPLIWRELNATNSPAQTRLIKLLRCVPIPALHLAPAEIRQAHARDAIFTLGTNAAPLAPYLTVALNVGEPQLSANIFYLRLIGRPAIPALREALHAADPWVRLRAGIIMAQIDTGTTNHLPVLVEAMLQTGDPKLRREAIQALSNPSNHTHGYEPIFRAVLLCRHDRDPYIHDSAGHMLNAIAERDPALFRYLQTTAAQTNDLALAEAAREAIEILQRQKMGQPTP